MNMHPPSDAPTRLIRLPVVKERTALSESTLWRLRKKFLFPEPIRISPGAVAWREADIEAWIAARARDTELLRAG